MGVCNVVIGVDVVIVGYGFVLGGFVGVECCCIFECWVVECVGIEIDDNGIVVFDKGNWFVEGCFWVDMVDY